MATEQKSTEYGTVYRLTGGCKDDWSDIETMENYRKASGLTKWRKRPVAITGQLPMLKAIRAAEAELGREIVVTGSFRTCAFQAAKYKEDPNRYAPPYVGLHCQGLAIDVTTADPELKTRVKHALLRHGFTQARPDDEPWHFSYGWTA